MHASSDWGILDAEGLKALDQARNSKSYVAGELIFMEGDQCDGLYCIEQGQVGVRKTDVDGNSVLLYISVGGETMGYRAVIAEEPYMASGEALKASRVCHIQASTMRDLLRRNPAFGYRYLQRISNQLGAAELRILQNIALSVRARFAHLLVVLMDRYQTYRDGDVLVMDLPISRHDLASMIGTTPESMSRVIRKLEEDDVALFKGRMVRIPDLKTLISEFEPHLII